MRRFEPVAALGGVLLGASLFAPWYRSGVFIITRGGAGTETKSSLAGPARVTAWEAFTTVDVLLMALAVQRRAGVVSTSSRRAAASC